MIDPGREVGEGRDIWIISAGTISLDPLLHKLLQVGEAGPCARGEAGDRLHAPALPVNLQALVHQLRLELEILNDTFSS